MATTLKPDLSWYAIDPAFYEHGGVGLSPEEDDVLSECEGLKVLVMPAGGGEEALSLVNLGADVTVFDNAEGLAKVRDLLDKSKLAVRRLEGDPTADELPGGPYDIIYSGFGLLEAVGSLDEWAKAVEAALNTGGRLVIHDVHPMAYIAGVHRGLFTVAHSYFADEEDGMGPAWTMGELITELGLAGLATVLLEESPDSERYPTPIDRFQNIRIDVRWRLAGAFLLLAIKL